MLSTRIKILLLFLLCLSNFLISTSYTDADIFAERVVPKNRFSMASLDILTRHSSNNSVINFVFHTLGLQPGGFDLGAVKVKKGGTLDTKYHLKVLKTEGSDAFCNALKIEVLQKNLEVKYRGKLMDLNIDSESKAGPPESWIFVVSLDNTDDSLQDRVCEFSFIFRTWRTEPDEKKGIYAERVLNNVISSGNW